MFSKFGQRHEEIAFLVKQKYAKRDLLGIISCERPRFPRLNVLYPCVHRHRRGPPFSSFLRRPAQRRG